MATAYPIEANHQIYMVIDDCTTVYAAVVIGRVTDEIFGDFMSSGLMVTVSRDCLKSTTTTTGLYAVTGYPDQAFPNLNMASDAVDLAFSVPGFQSQNLHVIIPQNATFPVNAADLALRRLPVSLQGRVVDKTNRNPISGALVLSIDNPVSPPAIHALALRSPLYLPHANATPVQNVTITPSAAFQLTTDAAAGTTVLNFSSRSGMGANSILQLSNQSRSILEYCIVDHLGSGAANQPGQVFIRQPLNRSYAAGAATSVRAVTAAPSGAPAQLSGNADAGDGILLATQLLNGNALVVDPGTPANTEYHELGALTDNDGYYGITGAGRTRELFLQASHGGSTSDPVDWFLQFERNVNIVNFLL
jgi:hypothetical protein